MSPRATVTREKSSSRNVAHSEESGPSKVRVKGKVTFGRRISEEAEINFDISDCRHWLAVRA
jgi:hypothetical protein